MVWEQVDAYLKRVLRRPDGRGFEAMARATRCHVRYSEARSAHIVHSLDRRAVMTAEEFATALGRLIAQARADGLTDEAIIAGLEEAIDAIEEELD